MTPYHSYSYKSDKGFTLIEALIALALVGGILVVLGALVVGAPLSRLAAHQGLALSIAGEKLEEIRAGGYAALPPSGPLSDPDLALLPIARANLMVESYNGSTKEVVVTVSWQEPTLMGSSTVKLSTLVTEVGGLP